MVVPVRDRLRAADGAIVIQVAVALFVLTLASAFVIDYGVQLISRQHIQNAVDAGALAGATALAYDSYTDRGDTGVVKTTAIEVARSNLVWNTATDVAPADVTFTVCPDSFDAGPSATPILACVQVQAFRNIEHNNPLPTYIGKLMGINEMEVAASATGEARDANATDCLKPLAIPDRWTEKYPVNPGAWSPASTFEKWDPADTTQLLSPPDTYTAPTGLSSGTSMKITVEFGSQVVLNPGATAIPITTIKPWRYLAVQIPGSTQGPNNVRANVEACAASPVAIGDTLNIINAYSAAEVAAGLQKLVNDDPGAGWDAANSRVINSCADVWPRCASISPRVIALPTFDPSQLADASRAGATTLKVRNVVGFFISSVDLAANTATGYITRHPGLINTAAPILIDASTFLRASLLVK
jgi:hypothetical protein